MSYKIHRLKNLTKATLTLVSLTLAPNHTSYAANLPANVFEYAVDNTLWTGGEEINACPTAYALTSDGCSDVFPVNIHIEAEDYSAFSDTSAGNKGNQYRNDDVDIQATHDESGEYNIGWTVSGEWLEYDVELLAGTYDITTRIASIRGQGNYTVSLNGNPIATNNVDSTGGWQTWESHDLGEFTTLLSGKQTIRIDINSGGFNFNYFDISLVSLLPADGDSDGVEDYNDLCPDTPQNTAVDLSGCEISIPPTKLTGTATASSELQASSNATDNRPNTRWESNHDESQSWITIDLGSTFDLSEVNINWEAANAESYIIQGSNDNSSWADITYVTGGQFGARTDSNSVSGTYRYVRIYSTSRSKGNLWGYSIFDIEVYGSEVITLNNNEVRWSNNRLVGGAGASAPGFTLYTFNNDLNTSSCYDACAITWPPLLVSDGLPSGVSGLDMINRADGSAQVTYNNKPLYYYNGDNTQSDINGHGLGNLWKSIVKPTVIRVEAEDYINALDTGVSNNGREYREGDVDIQLTSDIEGKFNVGWTDTGEWLEYSVNLSAGTYRLATRVASPHSSSGYNVSLNNNFILSDGVSTTGGWQAWESHDLGEFTTRLSGEQTIRINITSGGFNFNYFDITLVSLLPADSDSDGVKDSNDLCSDTPINTSVDLNGCEISIPPIKLTGTAIISASSELQASSNAIDGHSATRWESNHGESPSWITIDLGSTFDLSDVTIDWEAANAESYFIQGSNDNSSWEDLTYVTGGQFGARTDSNSVSGTYRYVRIYATSRSEGNIWGYSIYEIEVYGSEVISVNNNEKTIQPLFDINTSLEQEISFDRGDALVTRFADRGRDRHAKEDQFQAYDHYLPHYWTHRTAQIQFEDYVAKGGNRIDVTFITEWKLGATEFRAWYRGLGTVAEYHGNYGGLVVEEGSGTYDHNFTKISDDGDQYRYTLSINEYRALSGEYFPLENGQRMEIEISQFLDGVPEGRENYYGTTYLYLVGEGFVPWYTQGDFADPSSLREDSFPIPMAAWLGGTTTLPYGYTNEPDNHFMQMTTNLSNINGQAFVLGRRIHHTDFITGEHDESVDNGIFEEMIGKAGTHYINNSCANCHERNGRATPAEIGESLNKWVFQVANANNDSDNKIGRVLQPNNVGIIDAEDGEGSVTLASWTEVNGLRSPNYNFTKHKPERFSARIAPQLVGMGLLEAIDEGDILALEDTNDRDNDGISGRAQRISDPITGNTHLGRFGWKASKASITHQVAAALNTDMGVMTSVLPSPDCGADQTTCGESSQELSDEDLNNLVKYISLLGVRPQRDYDNADVQRGQDLFSNIGCNSCHVDTFTTSKYHPYAELREQTIHPYSDLLLHDMGEGLADNLGEGDASGSEWRTTPLWGLGLSACVSGGVVNPSGKQGNEECSPKHSYLHDGRARTIEEAILWHGGEGENAKQSYQELTSEEKAALLAFLNSL